jgi:hypothetical protein
MIKASVEVNTASFDRAITRTLAATGRPLQDITRDAAQFFLQSAAMATPPDEGRRRFSKKSLNRPVIALRDKDGKRTRYKVPYRTSKARGRKFFGSLSEAKEFAKVKWRGVGRAGWWASLPAFGVSTATQPGTATVHRAASRFGRGMMTRELFNPAAVMHNMAGSIKQGYAEIIARKALRKAGNRLFAASKKMLQNAKSRGWK